MRSLSSRKSWDIFALSIEKIDFLIFSYLNLRAHLWAQITPEGKLRPRSCNFFWILHSWINNPTLALFWFRPYFEKFFTLKLKLLKNAFGTRTLKPIEQSIRIQKRLLIAQSQNHFWLWRPLEPSRYDFSQILNFFYID